MTQVVDSAEARPTPALAAFVHRYIGYFQDTGRPGVHRGLPSPYLTFIITLGPKLHLAALPDPADPPAQFDAMLSGLHARPATIVHDGIQAGVQIELHPLAATALFGVPARELASKAFHLEDVVGRAAAAEVVDRMRDAPHWRGRFAVLDEVLARRIRTSTRRPEVDFAWRTLVAAHGAVDIGTLAQDVGWSRRHLSEQFGREFGLSPKTAARIMRFTRSRKLVEAGMPLSAAAAAAGFFDQAHLYRDWQDMAGCPPTTWLAEELPFVQDDAAAAAAS